MPIPRTALIVLPAAAALFIVASGQSLPQSVASHFAASGFADGYSSRGAYLALMIVAAAGLPAAVIALQTVLGRKAPRLGVPHGEYWLAPERRDATLAFLDAQALRFAALIAAFLCFVHWLVVKGNAVQPPRMDGVLISSALIVFLLATAAWLVAFYVRFRRRA